MSRLTRPMSSMLSLAFALTLSAAAHADDATGAGPAIPNRMFFFFSEELRRINRAPTALNSNTYDPTWLTNTTSPNYVPPALRDPNAVKLLALWPAPNVQGPCPGMVESFFGQPATASYAPKIS